MIHYFDRSRRETDEKCPRLRYIQYHYDGQGIQRIRLNQHLTFGGAVHDALAYILSYCRDYDNIPDMQWITGAVLRAQATMREEFANAGGFASEPIIEEDILTGGFIEVAEDQQWMIDHYCDLLEALVVGWCLVRLPLLMQQYRVLEVEQEKRLVLGKYGTLIDYDATGRYVDDSKSFDLTFLSRPDALLQRRTDGAHVILNFKTTSDPQQWWMEQWKIDQQTISEVLPVEFELGHEVVGVLIEGLTKGKQVVEFPKGSGHWHHSSPLVWGYLKEEGGLNDDWQAQWVWTDEAGNSRRLGKGYNRQRIAATYSGGIAEWVGRLYQNENALLRAQFPAPPLISRSQKDIEEWLEQAKLREVDVHNALVQISAPNAEANDRERVMARYFPKYTHNANCLFPSKCSAYEVCWGAEGADPLGSGKYKYRVPNHPEVEEVER